MIALLDIAAVAVLLICVLSGIRKGLVKSVFDLLGTVAAFLVAFLLAAPVSAWIEDAFMRDFIERKVVNGFAAIANVEPGDGEISETLSKIDIQGIVDDAPAALKNLLAQYGVTVQEVSRTVQDTAVGGAESMKEAVIDSISAPISSAVSYMAAFASVFLIAIMGIFILSGVVCTVFRLPVLRQADRLCGAALGLVIGVLWLSVLAFVLRWLLPTLGEDGFYGITAETLNKAVLFGKFYDWNIVSVLLGW